MAEIWMPDFPPATPNANDDEFADASLAAAWTELDNDSSLTVTEGESGLKLVQTSAAGNRVAGVFRTLPTGDFTAWTKVGLSSVNATSLAGIMLAEDLSANPTTANIAAFVVLSLSGADRIQRTTWDDYATSTTGIGETYLSDVSIPFGVYLRIRRPSGSDTSFDYSKDGIGWYTVSKTGLGFTPVHIGLCVNNTSSADISGMFSFFRVVQATPAVTDVMFGRRIDPENPPVNGGDTGQPIALRDWVRHTGRHWRPQRGL